MFVIDFFIQSSIGVLASDDGKVLGQGSRFKLYLQAICALKDSTDEKDRVNAPSTPSSKTVENRHPSAGIANVCNAPAHVYRP